MEWGRWLRQTVALGALAGAWTCVLGAGWPDGSLPPLPYHYLHPPAALAADNQSPAAGMATVLVRNGQTAGGHVFTADGQAGISFRAGGFRVSGAAARVRVDIRPVEIPPRLPALVTEPPSQLPQLAAADGNAYRVSAWAEPGNRPALPQRPIALTLHWPHLPIAVYAFAGGTWRRLCTSAQSELTASTITCSTTKLGTFVAVTVRSVAAATGPPATPARRAGAGIYIVAALLVGLLGMVAMGFLIAQGDDRFPREGQG